MDPKYRIIIPLVLAAIAAGANFVLLKRATKTQEILVLAKPVNAGEELTIDHLKFARIRADPAVFAAACPSAQATDLIHMPYRRDAKAGEVILWADIDPDAKNRQLREGERDGRILVPASEYRYDLSADTAIEFVVPGDNNKPLILGPFRVLSTTFETHQNGQEKFARVTFAGKDLDLFDEVRGQHPEEHQLAKLVTMRRVANAPKDRKPTRPRQPVTNEPVSQ